MTSASANFSTDLTALFRRHLGEAVPIRPEHLHRRYIDGLEREISDLLVALARKWGGSVDGVTVWCGLDEPSQQMRVEFWSEGRRLTGEEICARLVGRG